MKNNGVERGNFPRANSIMRLISVSLEFLFIGIYIHRKIAVTETRQ